jgi:hypothetical protein
LQTSGKIRGLTDYCLLLFARVRDITLDSLRANVGVVMQDVFLFDKQGVSPDGRVLVASRPYTYRYAQCEGSMTVQLRSMPS